MSKNRVARFVVLFVVVGLGLWLVMRPVSPAPESASRTDALRALGPAGVAGSVGANAAAELGLAYGSAAPVTIDLRDVPVGGNAVDPVREKYLRGEIDLNEIDGPLSEREFLNQLRASLNQGTDRTAQVYDPNAAVDGVLNSIASFKAIDYTQSQQGVPPDPEIMVGTNHVVVSVNTSFQVFSKTGVSLYGPVLFTTFWGNTCGTGSGTMVLFDPFSTYDESAHRYVLGITGYDSAVNNGDNGWACIAVSTSDSATGTWNKYSFDGNPGAGTDYFLDYPHIGTGQTALYLGANMFGGGSFVRNQAFAFDKNAMYAGTTANSVKVDVSSTYFTLQPTDLKGYSTGGWPTNANEPHYYFAATYGSNQTQLQVFKFNTPWGTPSVTLAGTVTVNSYSLPVSQPQSGSTGRLQGNDNRMLDAEYWGGKIWGTHTIGCKPGATTVNCIRWYQINMSTGTPSLLQQGTFSTSSEYRSFPDLAVNSCGDMLVGYTKTSSSIFPGVFVAGREVADAAGTLKSETTVHVGEAYYTAYDSSPRRWGDYTGMTIDPDGKTFWYLGEYSRNQATARWSTWVGAYQWSLCTPGGATPTPTPPPGPTATPTNTPIAPTPTPVPPTPTPVPGGNLIQNGDFEAGRTIWTEYSAKGYQVICTTSCGTIPTPHSGSWLAWMGGANTETARITQGLTLPAGSSYLHYWYRISSNDACGYDYGRVQVIVGGTTNTLATYNLCSANNTANWVYATVNVSSYAGQTVSVRFEGTTDSSLISSFYIDDVVLNNSATLAGQTGDAALAAPQPKPDAALLAPVPSKE